MPRAPRPLPLLVLLAAALPARAAVLHPHSMSSSRVIVTGATARLELHCQAQSLLEVFGADADRDRDGALDDGELKALRAPLQDYVNAHYVLRAGSGGDDTRGAVLPGALTGAHASAPDPDAAWPTPWVDLAFRYEAPEPIPDLLIDVTLFREAAPDHSDLCDLVWNGAEPLQARFWLEQKRCFYAPDASGASAAAGTPGTAGTSPQVSGQQPLSGWVRLGIGHILSGWDHIAFLVALIVAAGSARALLGVVTAFTLAHSVTLALAALGVVHVSGRPVEVVIALSIAWVGAVTLLARRPRARWREAFVFGLVHGLGFAGFLGEALRGEQRPLRALVGFNLGVEAGQLAVVAVVLVLLGLLRSLLAVDVTVGRGDSAVSMPSIDEESPRTAWLAPRPVRVLTCAVIVPLALFWAGQRMGW